MKTTLLVTILILAAGAVHAQPTTPPETLKPTFDTLFRSRLTAGARGWSFRSAADGAPASGAVRSLTQMIEAERFQLNLEYRKPKRSVDVDWLGLLTEQARVDGIMHLFRFTAEPKTRAKMVRSRYLKDYTAAVKGYFDGPPRWADGDPFVGNNINHPLMGAVSSHAYTNNDRRCKGVQYGDANYWSCIRRATIFSVLASVSWEWNPLMSESALGNVGSEHTMEDGKRDGGWTDFVMTPAGGFAIRVAGDIARARLWPVLDRHLSGNLAARVAKVALKVVTDPGRLANCAFNADFRGALASGSPLAMRRVR